MLPSVLRRYLYFCTSLRLVHQAAELPASVFVLFALVHYTSTNTDAEGAASWRAQRLLRQYLYFYTSKASKFSTWQAQRPRTLVCRVRLRAGPRPCLLRVA